MRAFLVCFVLAAAACGGVVQGDPDGGFPCPVTQPNTLSCSSENAQCTFATTICGQPSDETCTCKNGEWACPSYDCPAQVCPANPAQDTACSVKQQVCPMPWDGCPEDQDMICVCDGTRYQCPQTSSCSACPPADQVFPDGLCSGLGEQCSGVGPDCDGGVSSMSCSCQMGRWECAVPVCGGVVDAGGAD